MQLLRRHGTDRHTFSHKSTLISLTAATILLSSLKCFLAYRDTPYPSAPSSPQKKVGWRQIWGASGQWTPAVSRGIFLEKRAPFCAQATNPADLFLKSKLDLGLSNGVLHLPLSLTYAELFAYKRVAFQLGHPVPDHFCAVLCCTCTTDQKVLLYRYRYTNLGTAFEIQKTSLIHKYLGLYKYCGTRWHSCH